MFKAFFRPVAIVIGALILVVVVGIESFKSGAERTRAAEVNDSKLQALQRNRLALLRDLESQWIEMYKKGVGSVTQLVEANKAVLNAELDLCRSNQERTAVLTRMLRNASEFEENTARQAATGVQSTSAVMMTKVHRLEIEIALERLNSK